MSVESSDITFTHFMDTGMLDEAELEEIIYRSLREEFDTSAFTEEELKEYRMDPVKFVEYELHFHSLTPKQKTFLRSFVGFKNPYTIIRAARGSGKTYLMSILVIWACVCYRRFQICIVSGSFEQSLILYNYCVEWIYDNPRIHGSIYGDPLRNFTVLRNGSWFKCLTASERQVRGPHPNILIVDECVLVKPTIYKSAIGMLGDRRPMCLIIASTPQNDVGIILFRDLWENPDFQKNQYHWTVYDCPWKDQDEIARKRRQMTKDEFATDHLGEFSSITGAVYDLEDILNTRISYLPKRDVRFFAYMGIDWGIGARTFLTITQKNIIKKKYEVIWAEQYTGWKFVKILERVAFLYHYFDVNELYADSSHESENERLEDIYGLNLNRVAFGKMVVPKTKTRVERKQSIKEVMIRNSKEKFELGMLIVPSREFAIGKGLKRNIYKWIPKAMDVLIKQCRNYHRNNKGKIVKEDDHGVDSLQLGLFGHMGGHTPTDMEMEVAEVEMA